MFDGPFNVAEDEVEDESDVVSAISQLKTEYVQQRAVELEVFFFIFFFTNVGKFRTSPPPIRSIPPVFPHYTRTRLIPRLHIFIRSRKHTPKYSTDKGKIFRYREREGASTFVIKDDKIFLLDFKLSS